MTMNISDNNISDNNGSKNGFSAGKAVMWIIMLAVCGAVIYGGYYIFTEVLSGEDMFVAGRTGKISIYRIKDAPESASESADSADDELQNTADSDSSLEKAGSLIRGTAVTKYNKTITADGQEYVRIKLKEDAASGADRSNNDIESETAGESASDLYISADNLSEDEAGIVQETEVYVRTPVTILSDAEGPAIAGFAAKGTCLRVKGYDRLLDNGYINKYKVEYETDDGEPAEGYVYGKYMTDTQKKADKPYNKHGEYDAFKNDNYGFNLYGGKAGNLDYYPYERPVIAGNEFCKYARAMYINAYAAVHSKKYAELVKNTDCNAVVIDLKDGMLTWESEVAKELSPTSYKHSYVSEEELREGIDRYRDTGAYLIGRIVVFNDQDYAKDHPEDCIKYGGSRSWPSGYSRGVWEYNVRLAQEAIEKFGLNEIQFDYVRFPESTYDMSKSGKADFRNKYGEEKAQAIQNFCYYAADQIHEAGAYLSVDVFGESVYGYVTAYGQYWPAISNIVDAISAMPYTDHTGGEGAWKRPYHTVYTWAKKARNYQRKLQNPAVARTWITGYNTPYWGPTEHYGADALNKQAKALEDAGLHGGFIPWNSASDLDKYYEYKSVWNEK